MAWIPLVLLLALFGEAWRHSDLASPPPTLLLLDREGRFLADVAAAPEQAYGFWPVKELPPRVVAATLALEDQRFWSHFGVDPVAVARAIRQNVTERRRISGASTIAMQVARMQDPGPRTWSRKVIEAATALLLTARHGREAVLAEYLRRVPYGNNIHGIAYAARRYLDKPVEDLSWAEIAFLAAIPQAPTDMNPYQPGGRLRAVARGQRILASLREKGVIDSAEFNLARLQLDQLQVPRAQQRPAEAMHAILKMEQRLRRQPVADGGGPIIRTSIDLKLQGHVSDAAAQALDEWRHADAEKVAVIVLERSSNEVLAWVGSEGYFAAEYGAIDFTQVPRSPGSALKPFIFAHALDRGEITPGTVLYDLPALSKGFSNIDRQFLGPMLPRQALANSRNVPAMTLVDEVGVDETYLFLHRLGLHDNRLPAQTYGLGMAVGTLPTTLERVVRAYGALANEGVLRDLVWIHGQSPSAGERMMSAETARLVALFLADPLARLPSFPRLGTTEYPFPVAVKTGTSQGYRDAWTVAWSTRYLVGVWVGRADTRPMRKLGGAGSAADLAQTILMDLHKDQEGGTADLPFPPPSGYAPHEICAYTGQGSAGLCDPTFTEWFPASQPPEGDTRHVRVWVDSRTDQPAGPTTPKRYRKSRVFIRLPPMLHHWAETKNIGYLPLAPDDMAGPKGEEQWSEVVRAGERTVRLRLESPLAGARLYQNPEVPPELNSVALRVTVEPEVKQVLWYVDGKPYQLAAAPYTVRWPLQKGSHTFQARLPYREEHSDVVEVRVD